MSANLFNNWQAKVVCFVMAVIIWTALKYHLEPDAFGHIISDTVPTSSK